MKRAVRAAAIAFLAFIASSLASSCSSLRIRIDLEEVGRFLSPTSRSPSTRRAEKSEPARAKPKAAKPAAPEPVSKTGASTSKNAGEPAEAKAIEEHGTSGAAEPDVPRISAKAVLKDPDRDAFFAIADRYAAMPGPGGRVLSAALARIRAGTILKGSCWDFVNAVYDAAGYAAKRRKSLFSAKETGPYADPAILMPGDWVGSRNIYSATVSHSAIFVEWLDFDSRTALTIDYPGAFRNEPGRFRVSDVSKLFMVVRGAE